MNNVDSLNAVIMIHNIGESNDFWMQNSPQLSFGCKPFYIVFTIFKTVTGHELICAEREDLELPDSFCLMWKGPRMTEIFQVNKAK